MSARARRPRVRIVGVTLQPQLVLEDDKGLAPIDAQPLFVNGAEWPDVVSLLAKAVSALEARLCQPDPQER